MVESFELKNAEALVTACTVPADDPLYQTAKGFCLGYMTGAMELYRAAAASPNVESFRLSGACGLPRRDARRVSRMGRRELAAAE